MLLLNFFFYFTVSLRLPSASVVASVTYPLGWVTGSKISCSKGNSSSGTGTGTGSGSDGTDSMGGDASSSSIRLGFKVGAP